MVDPPERHNQTLFHYKSIFLVKTIFNKGVITDSLGRSQYIHAKAEVSTAFATVNAAHARPSPPEYLPIVRMRKRKAIPRSPPRCLRGKGGESNMSMMNLFYIPDVGRNGLVII